MNSDRPSPLHGAIAELILDSSLHNHVIQLLTRNGLFVHFRPDLEHCFHRKRAQEFSLIFPIAAMLWAVLLITVLAGSLWSSPTLWSADYPLWLGTAVVFTLAITGLNVCARLPQSHDFIHHYIIGPLAGGLLWLLLISTFAYPDGNHNLHASYNIITMMILISFSMRLLWHVSTSILLAAGGCAEIMLLINHWHFSSLQLAHACLLIGVVLTVVAFFVERRERFGFLNEVLVEIKSQELERLNHHLATLAREDALSGLANRRAFDDVLGIEWERGRREQHPIAVVFIDVDFFKLYNDNYGHAAGDTCLRQVAFAIKQSLHRATDLAARYGGEEFVVLLPNTDILGAREVAERILAHIDSLAIPHERSHVASHVTVSMGIASLIPSPYVSAEQLLDEADHALYQAKSYGRHQYACSATANCLFHHMTHTEQGLTNPSHSPYSV